MAVNVQLPVNLNMALDVNKAMEFIRECRKENASSPKSEADALANSFRCLVSGLALHPLAEYLVNQRLMLIQSEGEPARESIFWSILEKDQGFAKQTCFKNTSEYVDTGRAARALLALIWLLS